jgi:hypothetical protein
VNLKSKIFLSLLVIPVLALSSLFGTRPARAQTGIGLENVAAAVRFGQGISFAATVRASSILREVSIVILDEAQSVTHVELLTVQPDGRTEFHYDARQNALRPFTTVRWNYRFTLTDGTQQHSDVFSTRYVDDRFDWQTLESGMLRVSWYAGEAGFGQAALRAAEAGLESVSRLIPADLSQPVEFFIYETMRDLQGTLSPGSQSWIAGHADPALGVVMVAIEPGPDQQMTLEQRLPHELMHVMLYRAADHGYENIPAWLNEGMSSLAEIAPNPAYERVLAEAAARQDWIPIAHLCSSFPADTGRAYLAYAESQSFAGYVHQTYGAAGLLKLAASYANGADCESGPETALGVPFSKLELDWNASVMGQNGFLPALQNISPYLVVLLLILIVPAIRIFGTMRGRESRHEPGTDVRK